MVGTVELLDPHTPVSFSIFVNGNQARTNQAWLVTSVFNRVYNQRHNIMGLAHLVCVETSASTLVFILLGCANKNQKKEFAFSLKWRMCVRVSPPWSLVSVVAHPNDRRSHPIQPTNPFAYLHILHICQSIGCIVKTSFPHSFSVASPRIPLKHIVSQMPNHGLCSTMNTIFLPYLMRF